MKKLHLMRAPRFSDQDRWSKAYSEAHEGTAILHSCDLYRLTSVFAVTDEVIVCDNCDEAREASLRAQLALQGIEVHLVELPAKKIVWLLRGPSASGKTAWAHWYQYKNKHVAITGGYIPAAIRFGLDFNDEVIVDANCGEGVERAARAEFESKTVEVRVKTFPDEEFWKECSNVELFV